MRAAKAGTRAEFRLRLPWRRVPLFLLLLLAGAAGSAAGGEEAPAAKGPALDEAARAARQRGDLAGNLRFLEAARDAYAAAGDADAAAIRQGYVGNALAQLGELAGARRAFDDALRRMGPGVPASRRAVVLRNYGLALSLGGQVAAALRELERAEPLQSDPRRRADIRLQRATLLARLGDLERAEVLADEALAALRAPGDPRTTAGALARRANVALLAEDPERAHRTYREAAGLYEAAGAGRFVLRCRLGAALALRRLGRLDEAATLLAEVRRAAEAAGDANALASSRLASGDLALARGRAEEARDRFRAVLAAGKDAEALAAYVPAGLEGLAAAELGLGRPREALAASGRALARIERGLLGLDERRGTLAWEGGVRPLATGLAAALALDDPVAFVDLLEHARGNQLLRSLDYRARLQDAVVPAPLRLLEGERRLAASLARRAARRAAASPDRTTRRRARRALRTAQDALLDVIGRIQQEARAGAAALYPHRAPLPEVRAHLAPGEVLVAYALPEAGTPSAVVVTRDGARLVALAERAAIERAAGALALDDKQTDPTVALARLRALVVAPLALSEGTRRLLVSPDGPLAFVPFAALRPDLEIAYVPSATTLVRLRGDPAPRGTRVLAVGDPVYGADPGAGAVPAFGTGTLERLPASRAEAEAVGDVVLLGPAAREGALRERLAAPGRWRAVHLACHGVIDARRPMFSALALTPGPPGAGPADDGFLTWNEVFALEIRADLAVLSACRTARGVSYQVEGIRAFPRAFLGAGVPRVLVSLWPVPDGATAALMQRFYQLLGTAPPGRRISTAAALRGAQAHLRAQARWRHPRYWAAWELWGRAD